MHILPCVLKLYYATGVLNMWLLGLTVCVSLCVKLWGACIYACICVCRCVLAHIKMRLQVSRCLELFKTSGKIPRHRAKSARMWQIMCFFLFAQEITHVVGHGAFCSTVVHASQTGVWERNQIQSRRYAWYSEQQVVLYRIYLHTICFFFLNTPRQRWRGVRYTHKPWFNMWMHPHLVVDQQKSLLHTHKWTPSAQETRVCLYFYRLPTSSPTSVKQLVWLFRLAMSGIWISITITDKFWLGAWRRIIVILVSLHVGFLIYRYAYWYSLMHCLGHFSQATSFLRLWSALFTRGRSNGWWDLRLVLGVELLAWHFSASNRGEWNPAVHSWTTSAQKKSCSNYLSLCF